MNEKNIVYGRKPIIELPQKSLGKLFLQSVAATNRNHIAFVNENTGETLTYGQLLDTSCRLAQSLTSYGVTQDQIIAIASDNHVNNFIILLAAFFAGIPIALINPKFTEC
ncbi:long-chain-fatty-acid--coa ligase [Holotrichia oblita]|uniref:Long-chain-fatty-acid--coa ligase n=1 Tax=Holotrichia oblita TaxID=644536 RepID=A0ACB9TPS7_HOLOL|nr:long-chain-fatty-acid--coa ligase [Holotrichia oblita]